MSGLMTKDIFNHTVFIFIICFVLTAAEQSEVPSVVNALLPANATDKTEVRNVYEDADVPATVVTCGCFKEDYFYFAILFIFLSVVLTLAIICLISAWVYSSGERKRNDEAGLQDRNVVIDVRGGDGIDYHYDDAEKGKTIEKDVAKKKVNNGSDDGGDDNKSTRVSAFKDGDDEKKMKDEDDEKKN
ncbi:hypothetical protein HELRODRAFT_180466 [Helobdella robusta]|uniref:Uncharacterized protein n=1 Tax=Helobdella robusta TaxID=6412 RepID=T1FFY5_HELRO|nr:hypothetical protein HELRODRAFT_180466 [Helobdella robusta]ESN93815.1 hypothetical protein HELRODRAFT_180466 [Helobdella robusta]